jgi:cytoskeletal protein CcmA (bactofilin family)
MGETMAFKDPFKDLRGKSETGRSETRQPEPASVSQPKPGMTYIDEGCEFSGKLKFKDTVRIDGTIEGEIQSENTVVVGPSGVVRAKIQSDSVVVLGVVEGDILARRKITLHETAQVTGEIRTAGIVIEEGARFRGRIAIGSDDAKAAQTQAATKPTSRPAASAPPPPVASV